MSGWIKLHRKLSEKGFYSKDSEKVHLWIHLLLKANREPREELLGGVPIRCNSGQFTCGRQQLSKETGISESKIERILTYFEKIEQQIKQQKTTKNRLITIVSWQDYQQNEQPIEQQLNNNRTTTEQQLNTLQEVKRSKEYKNKLLSELNSSDVENEEYLKISQSFQVLFKENLIDAGSPTNKIESAKGKWYDDIRLMIEVDGYTIENLRAVWGFLKHDLFWKSNILSTSKLREQMPKLLLNIKNNGTNKQSNSKNQGASIAEIAAAAERVFGDLPDR